MGTHKAPVFEFDERSLESIDSIRARVPDESIVDVEITGARGKVITTLVFPPIPDRRFDWVAYFDCDAGEPQAPRGYGETEADALADLQQRVEDRS